MRARKVLRKRQSQSLTAQIFVGCLSWVRPAPCSGDTSVNTVLAGMAPGVVRETDKEKSNRNTGRRRLGQAQGGEAP